MYHLVTKRTERTSRRRRTWQSIACNQRFTVTHRTNIRTAIIKMFNPSIYYIFGAFLVG